MFFVVDRLEPIGEPEVVEKTDSCDNWIDQLFYKGDCTITTEIRFKAILDLHMCTAEELNPSQYTCPSDATVYLGEHPTKELSEEVTHTITIAEYQANIDPVDIVFGGRSHRRYRHSSGQGTRRGMQEDPPHCIPHDPFCKRCARMLGRTGRAW